MTGWKVPKRMPAPAYVVNSHISAPSVGTMKLANVDGTAGAMQAHVVADTGMLTISVLNPVMDGVSVIPAGAWKAGAAGRPGICEVV